MVLKYGFPVLAAASWALSGCVSNNPGWTGSGALPFDAALSKCQQQVDVSATEQGRKALDTCMTQMGWTRGRPPILLFAHNFGFKIIRL